MAIETTQLQARLEAIACTASGRLGLAIHDLDDDEVTVGVGAEQLLPTASVIKVPIMLEALRQSEQRKLDLQTTVTVPGSEQLGGSGILKAFQPGVDVRLIDAVTLMIVLSDNTATNIVLDAIGGVAPVNAALDELGCTDVRLHNRIDFELIGPDVRRLGEATPLGLSALLHRIGRRTAFSPEVSQRAEAVLAQQQYLDQFPRYFDMNPYWRELGATPTVEVACKTGFFTGTRVDAGIVRVPGTQRGFAYAVMNHEFTDETFLPEAEGAVVNGLIGREVLTAWWPQGPAPVVAVR